jgi:hypothetical protein
VSPEDVAAVAKKLLAQARAGDVAAAKVLLLYVVGKPAPVADPDRLDVDEFRLLRESPDYRDVEEARNRIAAALAVVLTGERLAVDRQGYARVLKERLAEVQKQLLRMPGGFDALLALECADDIPDDDENGSTGP